MTSLPAAQPGAKKLGLVIDLDTCVGCHACVVSCKEWNTFGAAGPLTEFAPYGAEPWGVWLNRVHSFEMGEGEDGCTVYFPKNCFHCEEPDCVTVCPTGASYKRAEDGIVLVDPALCIGCKLCSWACPYGARERAMGCSPGLVFSHRLEYSRSPGNLQRSVFRSRSPSSLPACCRRRCTLDTPSARGALSRNGALHGYRAKVWPPWRLMCQLSRLRHYGCFKI
jgi:Fe-S-cluster-containing dehydrogenase component